MGLRKLFALAFVLLYPAAASADPCSGAPPFNDFPATEIYCTNTEWLKNRMVTLGCTATNYCPNDPVTRASMALFMNRLGTALTPEFLYRQENLTALDPDDVLSNASVICQTGDYTVTGFPRSALVMSTFAGVAANALDFTHRIVFSEDAGATWGFYEVQSARGGASSSRWTNSSLQQVRNFDVNQTVRWGLYIGRAVGGAVSTEDFENSRCFLTIVIFNRNSSTPPFDGVRAR